MMDSIPLVVFTGQVAQLSSEQMHSKKQILSELRQPITKHNYQVQDVADFPRIIKEAFHIASTGRQASFSRYSEKYFYRIVRNAKMKKMQEINLTWLSANNKPNYLQIQKASSSDCKCQTTVNSCWCRCIICKSIDELTEFAEKYKFQLQIHYLDLVVFAGNHPLFLGMAGMHGTYTANMAITECDLLINIGARFDDRLTGNLNLLCSKCKSCSYRH